MFLKYFTYLLLERGKGKEKEKEKNIQVRLPIKRPLLGTGSATQACAVTGHRTCDPLVCRTTPSPLSPTSQGLVPSFNMLVCMPCLALSGPRLPPPMITVYRKPTLDPCLMPSVNINSSWTENAFTNSNTQRPIQRRPFLPPLRWRGFLQYVLT